MEHSALCIGGEDGLDRPHLVQKRVQSDEAQQRLSLLKNMQQAHSPDDKLPEWFTGCRGHEGRPKTPWTRFTPLLSGRTNSFYPQEVCWVP